MIDPTGEGWITHTMHGTSRLLELLGSDACRFGEMKTVFLEMRVFEVSRALLFQAPTFLASPQWQQVDAHDEFDAALDSMLRIMAQCADLCAR